ncbi:hypothetical protein Rsub_01028 [Raphidocelis subcapitata]|uniref:BTB domain-containing protein n=1 Tax=Raphidocelis subcapitata TaxID=307507 RepID=A0A2V0NLL5_9CHLO|nr:hypothetical protein Rsub_01028 [Raphidocelis subcapitata]|eukprot:GBF88316.1 hypothetical protein Rsub_01028 [Raphidocelis subcapitata]
MDLSGLFDDAFLSDFELELVSQDGCGGAPRRFPVHGAVLAGQSPYFKALLQNWTCADARLISLRLGGAAEREAAEMMIRAAYAGDVPADATPEQLLACMVLADRYALRGVVEACRCAIHAVDSARVSWPTTLALLHLPPGLQEVDAFSTLAEKAYQRVWSDFHNLDAAFQRASLRAAFLQLPRGAVEHLVRAHELRCVSENAVFLAVASWLRARARDAASASAPAPAAAQQGAAEPGAAAAAAEDAAELLRLVRYPQMSGNFLAAVASHEPLLRLHPDYQLFLLEATQYAMATEQQRAAMQGDRCSLRLAPRARCGEAPQSAFTSYIARDDLRTAVAKYRASGCRDAYYLLTEGHCWNGFTWRLKLTVKPPDPESGSEMNIHVGLCWSVEIAGEPLPLGESAVVAVEFSIATHDFTTREEDPTHSDGAVLIRAGTCWGWDDFFGRDAYADLDGEWVKWLDEKGRMPLTCHLYHCG